MYLHRVNIKGFLYTLSLRHTSKNFIISSEVFFFFFQRKSLLCFIDNSDKFNWICFSIFNILTVSDVLSFQILPETCGSFSVLFDGFCINRLFFFLRKYLQWHSNLHALIHQIFWEACLMCIIFVFKGIKFWKGIIISCIITWWDSTNYLF